MSSSPSPASGAADEAAPRKGALMRGGSFWDEGIYGLGCGLVYGMTSALVGFVHGRTRVTDNCSLHFDSH